MLESRGLLGWRVEEYNAFSRQYRDLFGFIDVLAVGPGQVVGCQTTSFSGMSSRRKKILEHENLEAVLSAGIRVELHGWRKVKNRYRARVQVLRPGVGFEDVDPG